MLTEQQRLTAETIVQLRTQSRLQQQAATQTLTSLHNHLKQVNTKLDVLHHQQQLTQSIKQHYRTTLTRNLINQQFVDEKQANILDQHTHALKLQHKRLTLTNALTQTQTELQQLPMSLHQQLTLTGASLQTNQHTAIKQATASH